MPTRRGFTLIELLVVVAIIAILTGILLPVLNAIKIRATYAACRTMLKNVEVALKAYDFDLGAYPPDQILDPIRGKTANSSEVLVYCLTNKFSVMAPPPPATGPRGEIWGSKEVGPLMELPAEFLKDTDGDGLMEIVDHWGRPIEYDNIVNDTSATGFNLRNPDDPRTDGKPRNPQGYDMFSRGMPGRNEPVMNWK